MSLRHFIMGYPGGIMGWPWRLDQRPSISGAGGYVERESIRDVVPDFFCELLETKTWRFSASYSGEDAPSWSFDRAVNSGVYLFDIESGEEFTGEEWATQDDAIHGPALLSPFVGVFVSRFENDHLYEAGCLLYTPALWAMGGEAEADDAWRMPVIAPGVVGGDGALVFARVSLGIGSGLELSDAGGIEVMGEMIGEQSGGWTLSFAPEDRFEE
jgi:hypothetical protein